MWRARINLLGVLFLASCVQSEVVSYTDPAQRSAVKYSSVLVVALGMGLQETAAVEGAATDAFSGEGVRARRSLDVIPPTRQMSGEEIGAAIRAAAVQSLLIIAPTEKGVTSTYVPPKYKPGEITGTVQPFGDMYLVQLHQARGSFSGGYTVSNPNARYAAVVADWQTARVVWQAEIASHVASYEGGGLVGAISDIAKASSGASSYEGLARGMAGDVVAKLIEDGVF